MNKDTLRFLLAVVSILFIMMFYQNYMAKYTDTTVVESNDTLGIDTLSNENKDVVSTQNVVTDNNYKLKKNLSVENFTVENNVRIFEFSNLGGSIQEIILKDYKYTGTDSSIFLVDSTYRYLSDYILVGDKRVDGDTIIYSIIYRPETEVITRRDSVVFALNVNGKYLKKTYFLYPDSFNVKVVCNGNESFKWGLRWAGRLLPTEYNVKDDVSHYKGFVGVSGGKTLFKYSYKNLKKKDISLSGVIDFIGIKSKYFVVSLIPSNPAKTDSYVFFLKDKDDPVSLSFDMLYSMGENPEFLLYTGPTDYDVLKSINPYLGNIVDFGWKYFAPIGKLILKIFKFLHKFIPNYGFVIIVFTILLFFLFFPITFKSFVSMRKMQALQPMIKELQIKYKNDPQKLNAEMMKLYKENGVNPMSGCFPMLLQLPIFFALFAVLRTNIALRGEPFLGWIKDLSVKDPYYVLPILTGIAMFISQKISNTDPKQKTMVYVMPVLMVFFFMNFPSGVLLYWVTYNIISIFQQYMVSRHPHVRGLKNN